MTKRTLIIILTFFLSSINYSQTYIPFPTDSSTWVLSKFCNPPCDPFSDNQPQQIVQHGDSLKNGLQYHKLYMVHTGTNSPLFHCLYREFMKKIYVKYPLGSMFGSDTSEFVLYNFNLNVGDTFTVKTPTNVSGPLPNTAKMKLNSVTTGTVSYSTGTRKLYSFSSVTTPSPTALVMSITWYEGIGSNQGLLYNLAFRSWPISVSPPNPYSYYLNCFYKSNSFIPNLTCLPTNISQNNKSLTNLFLYPNPSNDIVALNNADNINIKSVVLYNILGNICLFETDRQKMDKMNISHLSTGIYHCKITSENNDFTDFKIIKQ
jgi:hypothetical protein